MCVVFDLKILLGGINKTILIVLLFSFHLCDKPCLFPLSTKVLQILESAVFEVHSLSIKKSKISSFFILQWLQRSGEQAKTGAYSVAHVLLWWSAEMEVGRGERAHQATPLSPSLALRLFWLTERASTIRRSYRKTRTPAVPWVIVFCTYMSIDFLILTVEWRM